MKGTGVSARYATALMKAAEERGVLDGIQEDAQALLGLVRGSEDLKGFLGDILIHPEQKQSALRALFSGKVRDLALSFLVLLCDKRREGLLEDILEGFLDLLDERRGVETAQVRSASALTPEQEGRLAQRLSAFSGKQVRLEVEVDDGLRAGFVARMGDQVFDGTVEAQLNRLRRRLAAGL